MKKYTNTLVALLLAGAFVGCGSSNDTEVIEEANTTTSEAPKEETTSPVQTEEQNQKMPTCYIKKGTPVTENLITVHAKCKNGNIPIDEAKITLDNTVKPVDYKGTYFSDYIGFGNLQPNTTYKAVLEVVVGGKTIKKSVKIKTKQEKVEVTPTPTPTTNPHIAPKWSQKIYFKEIESKDFNPNALILNLDKIINEGKESLITYSIKNIDLSKYNLRIPECPELAYPYRPEKGFFLNNNVLKALSSEFNPCRYGIITLDIRAKSKYGFDDMSVDVGFLASTMQSEGSK